MIKWLIFVLALGVVYAASTGQQMKPKLNCTSVGDGNYVYGCSKVFYVCSNGILHSQHCLHNLFFDPKTNACQRENDIELCNTQNATLLHEPTRATDPFTCNKKKDGAYAVASCSNFFAHCLAEKQFIESCPSGLIWSDTRKVCDYPINIIGCQDKERLNTRSSNNETIAAPGYGPQDVPPPTFAQQQTAYERQFKLVPSTKNQKSESQISSPSQQQPIGPPRSDEQKKPQAPNYKNEFDCTLRKDGLYPSLTNACEKFFWKCAHGQTYKYNCPRGLFFSAQKVHCDFHEKVPECIGSGIFFYPDGPLVWHTPKNNSSVVPIPPQQQPVGYNQVSQNQPQEQKSVLPTEQPSVQRASLKITYDCQGKSDGFHELGKCQNDYVRCHHGTAYPQKCPPNLVLVGDLCEYHDECRPKPVQEQPSSLNEHSQNQYNQQQGQLSQAPETQIQQSPQTHPPALYSQLYTLKEAQQYAIEQTQQAYPQAQRPFGSRQQQHSQSPPSKSQQSTNQYETSQIQPHHSQQVIVSPPQQHQTYMPSLNPQVHTQKQQAVPQDNFCRERGLVQGYHSIGCNNYYYACFPHTTMRFTCQDGLFYDSGTARCNYKGEIPACGGTLPTAQPAQHPTVLQNLVYNQPKQYPSQNESPQHNQQQAHQPEIKVTHPQHLQNNFEASQPSYKAQPSYRTQHDVNQQLRQYPNAQQYQGNSGQVPSQQYNIQQPSQQSTFSHQPPTQSSQLSAPQIAPKDSYGQQSIQQAPPKLDETFCSDNNFDDGFHGFGCAPYFFVCALRATTRLHCPAGLYYDAEINECGPKNTVTACGGRKPTQQPVQQHSQGTYANQASRPALAQQTPAMPEFDCRRRQDGAYVNGCSSKYYLCNQEKSKTLHCPSNTYYSAATELCDFKEHTQECGGKTPTIPPAAQHPVLIPQQQYVHLQSAQQPPAASNYATQFKHKNEQSYLTPHQQSVVTPPPAWVSYPSLQQQPIKQNITVTQTLPAKVVDNKCQNYSSGIYGRRCSQFFFVCIEGKTFDFMCPKDQAFNLATVKCAPKTEISNCGEYTRQSAVPQIQQTYVQQPAQHLSSHAIPSQQYTAQQQQSVSWPASQSHSAYTQKQIQQSPDLPVASQRPVQQQTHSQQIYNQQTTQLAHTQPQLNSQPALKHHYPYYQQQSAIQNAPISQQNKPQIQSQLLPNTQQHDSHQPAVQNNAPVTQQQSSYL